MDLIETLRTTGAVRQFTDEAVPDAVVARVLDTARFAPNGGNRQAWQVVVVKDPQRRRRLRDLYLEQWYDYLAMGAAGLTPWSPLGDRDAERRAIDDGAEIWRAAGAEGPGFAEHLDQVPVLMAVFGDLSRLVGTDRDQGRYTFVAGASLYPFVWSVLLAARAEGLGGVMTTIHGRVEGEVKELLGAPEPMALAAVVALGRPVHQPTRLRREPLGSFATVDDFEGPVLQ
ncbi:nitroreductase family protein [Rhabdothermincola salaria]|uniref:nitroreductase family protein n=1 Tax=Rhabdothermincola salaria TaxID=2903142 RepID=UPI001E52FD1D|nr:nitroreductase family protein [Rhabdothermincola salaria]MCD9625713.1 nitroreductase family protein [Rhabdothermincola salaria]